MSDIDRRTDGLYERIMGNYGLGEGIPNDCVVAVIGGDRVSISVIDGQVRITTVDGELLIAPVAGNQIVVTTLNTQG